MAHIAGASVWEQELFDHISDHGAREGAMLSEYQRLAEDESLSAAFRYTARLILDEERRHHATFDDLATAVRQMAELREDEQPIPPLRELRRDRDRIRDVTERLLKAERDDVEALERLRKQMHLVKDTTLWSLLVELMEHDTQKHIKILRFIRSHCDPL
jgi:hypothetical protein